MTDLRTSFLHFPITDNPQQCQCNSMQCHITYVLICNNQYRQIQASIKINSSYLAFWLDTPKWPRTRLSSLPPGPRLTEPRVPAPGCLPRPHSEDLAGLSRWGCASSTPRHCPEHKENMLHRELYEDFSYEFADINYHNTSEYCVISLKGLSLCWIQ